MKLLSIFITLISACGAYASSPSSKERPLTQEDKKTSTSDIRKKLWDSENNPLTQEDLDRYCQLAHIERPRRPIDGKHTPNCNGVNFAGQSTYFHDTNTKNCVIKTLTGQFNDQDVTQHLVITKEDFVKAKATRESNHGILEVYLLQIGPESSALSLYQSELIVLLKELGEALGLPDDKILEKINSLINPNSH
ncbi:MAG: hypothetical protein LBJ13_02785 [Puniceicoccales bacterium]|nr:hypothetical protein [Puniceicoccales bacterium]